MNLFETEAASLLKSFRRGSARALLRFKKAKLRSENSGKAGIRKMDLTDARQVVAGELGFKDLSELARFVESMKSEEDLTEALLHRAFQLQNDSFLRSILEKYPDLKSRVNETVPGCHGPAILMARTIEMVDLLLEFGADLDAKSDWWAGGFGLLHSAPRKVALHAIKRGAVVDVHAAARLGLFNRLKSLIKRDPGLIHARGGDGQTPLHFASNLKIALFLVDQGADLNARDMDHESTPVQYMIKDRQDIARFLVKSGCETDIFLAAALGDLKLLKVHLEKNPDSIRMRVSGEHFPMIGRKSGGTIYQWMLGWHVSPHQVARNFGHPQILQYLLKKSPPCVALTNACWLHDGAGARKILRRNPRIVDAFQEEDVRQIVHAARNNDLQAVALMLEMGWPLVALGQHGGTPLHWAAWHGNVVMVKLFLRDLEPLEMKDKDFQATPIGWAVHASEHGWHSKGADYPTTVRLLFEAGAKLPEHSSGTAEVISTLSELGLK